PLLYPLSLHDALPILKRTLPGAASVLAYNVYCGRRRLWRIKFIKVSTAVKRTLLGAASVLTYNVYCRRRHLWLNKSSPGAEGALDRKSTRLNSSHSQI